MHCVPVGNTRRIGREIRKILWAVVFIILNVLFSYMASEQVPLGITLIALGFLWYSNEMNKKGNAIWAQAFQAVAFVFILADFSIMTILLRADGFYDHEDLIGVSLFQIVFWLMWILLGFWLFGLFLNLLKHLRQPSALEKPERIEGGYGAR